MLGKEISLGRFDRLVLVAWFLSKQHGYYPAIKCTNGFDNRLQSMQSALFSPIRFSPISIFAMNAFPNSAQFPILHK